MHETVDVPLADLLFDQKNARLENEQPSQQATALALAKAHGKSVLKLGQQGRAARWDRRRRSDRLNRRSSSPAAGQCGEIVSAA